MFLLKLSNIYNNKKIIFIAKFVLIILCLDYNLHAFNYNFIDLNISFQNYQFWKILFYFNNNNNNIVVFILLLILILTKYKNYKFNKLFFILYLSLILNLKFDIATSIDLIIGHSSNTSLVNGLLLIHPFFIYGSYIYIITIFFKKDNSILNKKIAFFNLSICILL